MIMYAHLMRLSVTHPFLYKSHQQQLNTRSISVDVPQPLADRHSPLIADLVARQIQCVQGGIVPVRGHTRHTLG